MIPYKLGKLSNNNNNLNGSWFVSYYFIHPETRKYKRFKVYISNKLKTKHARIEKGNELIRIWNLKLKNGYNPYSNEDRGLYTVMDAVNYIFKFKKLNLRKRSIQSYEKIVKNFNIYLENRRLSNLSVGEFNYNHARNFLEWSKITFNHSNTTYNNYKTCMNMFFNDMVARDIILVNPFKKVNKMQAEETDLSRFTDEELKIIVERLPEYNHCLWVVASCIFYCFIRPAEICKLKISDFNLDRGEINIKSSISKNKKSQNVTIPNQFMEILREHVFDKYPDNFYAFSKNLEPGEKMIQPQRIHEAWKKFTRIYDIDTTIYNFKHTGAGKAMEAGIDIRDLQLHMRHSSLTVTEKYLNRFRKQGSDKLKTGFPVM